MEENSRDAVLLEQVAEGDLGPPLEALYDRFAGRVYGLGLRLLGDDGLAQELVQETFMRVWRSVGRYDPDRGSVATWVFTIARRIAIDLSRRPSSRPFAEELGPETEKLADRATGEIVDRLLIGLDVRDALDSLSPSHREVLELLYLQDLTQAEAASRLDVPLGTVKTRSYHGIRALRHAFEERGVHA
ncbi:MAG TPA: sigma-70 family RNA polymerase sigma factor [Actinomycetes bacterium]|nr:sigma-70 family RNA polymerase sigma factor [Actinomycetes bacterium]